MRAAHFAAHILNIGANAIAGAEHLARDQIIAPHNGLAAPQIKHNIAIFDPLDHAINDLANTVFKLFKLLFAFGFAHALNNNLLGGLCGDAAKLDRRQFVDNLVADLRLRIFTLGNSERYLGIVIFDKLDHFDRPQKPRFTSFRVNLDTDIVLCAIARFGRLLNGVCHGCQHDLNVDAFFARDRVRNLNQFQFVGTNTCRHFRLLHYGSRMSGNYFFRALFLPGFARLQRLAQGRIIGHEPRLGNIGQRKTQHLRGFKPFERDLQPRFAGFKSIHAPAKPAAAIDAALQFKLGFEPGPAFKIMRPRQRAAHAG